MFGLAEDRIRHAGEGSRRVWQHPETGFQPERLRTRDGLKPGGVFARKCSCGRSRGGVRRIPQEQSADRAHLRRGGESAQKPVSLEQHYARAGAPGGRGCGHAGGASADDKHIAGKCGSTHWNSLVTLSAASCIDRSYRGISTGASCLAQLPPSVPSASSACASPPENSTRGAAAR